MPAIAAGVNAGGTSTTAVVSRDGTPSRSFTGPAGNASVIGVDAAAAAIAQAIEGARGEATGDRPDAIVVGAAGAGYDATARDLCDALRERFPDSKIVICDDGRIALRAAVPSGDGLVVIAGTGSFGYAEVDGVVHRAGGYGYLLGDEGSGFSLGNAAARILVRALDGRGPRDAMTDALAAALGVSDVRGFLEGLYRGANPIARIAQLAPIVLDHADRGERSAVKIVQAAALELADLVKTLVRTSNSSGRELPIVFSGGLLRANSLLTFLLETRLINDYPTMHVVKGAPEPHFGALHLAEALLR
jgi:N-acetylglucosamine kinase-like BadF-type ATPase